MKKLILFALVVALLLPASALALDGNSPFFGKWTGEEHHAVKHYDTTLHFVNIHKNGPSVYMVFYLNHGGPITRPGMGDPEMYGGSWSVVDDHVRVPTSPITYVDFYYDPETDTLYTEDPKVTYVRLP